MLRLNLSKTTGRLKAILPLPVHFKFNSSWKKFGVAVSTDLLALAGGEIIRKGKTLVTNEILFLGHEQS